MRLFALGAEPGTGDKTAYAAFLAFTCVSFLLAGTALLAWSPLSISWHGVNLNPWLGIGSLLLFALGLYLLSRDVLASFGARRTGLEPRARDEALYGDHLSLLGLAIVVLSLANAIVLSGLLHRGILKLASVANDGISLALGMSLALLGSLFFTANSLVSKRGSGEESFSAPAFWSGLWFRMGESILFTLVLFLLMAGNGDTTLAVLLPLALFMGMFVKSGERVVFGLAERMFEMARGLLPSTQGRADGVVPGAPRNLTLTRLNGEEGDLRWDEPLDGGEVVSYRVESDQQGSSRVVVETPKGTRSAKVRLSQAPFRIVAVNKTGPGPKSSAVEAPPPSADTA